MSKDNTKLEAGMMVNIYEDPITCEKLEGRAKLMTHQWSDQIGIEYWLVAFPDDGVPVQRKVNLQTAHQLLG